MIQKHLALTAILLTVVGMAQGADSSKPEALVRVFESDSVPQQNLLMAESIATEILASAGVRLRWSNMRSKPGSESSTGGCGTGSVQTIDLRFTYSTPADHKPGALAEAFLFAQSGVRITVFYDRVAKVLALRPRSAGRILGHVLAHETGHMLLRIASHAESGLMKAQWDADDYALMGVKTLSFTPEYATLIRSNLACSPAADTLVSAAGNQ